MTFRFLKQTLKMRPVVSAYVGYIICLTSLSAYPCKRGEFYEPYEHRCYDCATGTYMSEDYHVHRECHTCSEANEYDNEILKTPCTQSSDSEIGCIAGYYRHGDPHHAECTRCDDCAEKGQFEFRACGPHHNTICCPNQDDKLDDNNKATPLCTRPSDSENGCKAGYYRHWEQHHIECKRCKDCAAEGQFEFRACDPHNDAVCCPNQDDKLDFDFIGTPVCRAIGDDRGIFRQVYCETNEYSDGSMAMNFGNLAVLCKPCPVGTQVKQILHTKSHCDKIEATEAMTFQQSLFNTDTPRSNSNSRSLVAGSVSASVIVFVIVVVAILVYKIKYRRQLGLRRYIN